jgi:hypothetical protein
MSTKSKTENTFVQRPRKRYLEELFVDGKIIFKKEYKGKRSSVCTIKSVSLGYCIIGYVIININEFPSPEFFN